MIALAADTPMPRAQSPWTASILSCPHAPAGVNPSGLYLLGFAMPLELGNHPARLAPASGLIAEARMTPAHMVRGSSDRTLEQIADPVLEDPVGRQADRIFDPLGFQELVDLRHGERCVSAEIDTRELALVACNDRLEHAVPAVGADG